MPAVIEPDEVKLITRDSIKFSKGSRKNIKAPAQGKYGTLSKKQPVFPRKERQSCIVDNTMAGYGIFFGFTERRSTTSLDFTPKDLLRKSTLKLRQSPLCFP